jgi:hypothetical protein
MIVRRARRDCRLHAVMPVLFLWSRADWQVLPSSTSLHSNEQLLVATRLARPRATVVRLRLGSRESTTIALFATAPPCKAPAVCWVGPPINANAIPHQATATRQQYDDSLVGDILASLAEPIPDPDGVPIVSQGHRRENVLAAAARRCTAGHWTAENGGPGSSAPISRRSETARRRCWLPSPGYGQDENRRRSQEAGIDAHVVKPHGLDALHEILAGFDQQIAPPKPASD